MSNDQTPAATPATETAREHERTVAVGPTQGKVTKANVRPKDAPRWCTARARAWSRRLSASARASNGCWASCVRSAPS